MFELIIKYFLLCTDVALKEIDQIDVSLKAGDNPRDAKMRLAKEIVCLYHGSTEAISAEDNFLTVFKKGGVPDDMPEFKINGERNVIDLLELCKLISSKSEGRRAIEQGGVKIDDQKISSPEETIHLKSGMIIQVGKRRFARII